MRRQATLTAGAFWVLVGAFVVPAYALLMSAVSKQSFEFAGLTLAIPLCAYAFMSTIGRKYSRTPIGDFGAVYILIAAAYFFLPTLKFILSDYTWSILSDVRLVRLAPGQADLIKLFLYFLLHIFFFGLAYTAQLNQEPLTEKLPTRQTKEFEKIFFILFFVFVGLRFLFSISIGASSEYSDKINSVAGQPLLIRQLFFFFESARFGVAFIALFIAGLNYPRYSHYYWIILACIVIPPILSLGSRHEAFTFLLLSIILRHTYIRPMSLKKIIGTGTILIGLMLVLGAIRSYADNSFAVFLAANEFESMFATFYENVANPSADAPWTVYFSDFTALVPQQLLPFEKTDFATWYMKTYFPEIAEANPEIGMAFGVISESAIGFGLVDVAVRGFLLGWLAAKMTNYYRRDPRNVAIACLYFFCVVTAFRTFRTSSFEIIRSVVFTLGPALLIYISLRHYFGRSKSRAILPRPQAS